MFDACNVFWRSGSSSGVERKLPKLDVAGSTPVSRSIFPVRNSMPTVAVLLALWMLSASACGTKQLTPRSPLDSPENHYHRGLVELDRGELRLAQSQFERARSLDPGYAGSYVGRALVASAQGEFWEARNQVGTAIHKDNDFIDAHIAMGRIVTSEDVDRGFDTEDWLDEALTSFSRAEQIDSGSPDLFYYRAQSFLQARQLPSARESLSKVLELNRGPFVPRALQEMATIQMIERAAPGSRMGMKIALTPELNREELAVLLIEEMKLPELVEKRRRSRPHSAFPEPGADESTAGDLPAPDIAGSWARAWIAEALLLGVPGLCLFPDGTYQPTRPVSRANYALVVQGILALLTGDEELKTRYVGEVSRFPDVRSDFYAYNAIAVATERGIMSVDKVSGRFQPNATVSGAQALIIIRELQNAYRLEF